MGFNKESLKKRVRMNAWALKARDLLGRCDSVTEAAGKLGVSERRLREVFATKGWGAPSSYLTLQELPADTPTKREARLQKIADLTRHAPKPFEELCNELNVSPRRAREMIEEAQVAGYDVRVADGAVGRTPAVTPEPVTVSKAEGDWQMVSVISDTHLGSRYCLREQIQDFVNRAYENGVREILHPGDILDGCYRHGRWEVTHTSLDDQISDLLDVLPKRPGLSYHAIGGNHDETFKDQAGFDVGRLIEARFQDAGRDDFHFYGWRGAMLRVRGALFEMWHPRGSGAYAKSYKAQRYLAQSYGPWKPDVLLIGHFHTFNYCVERGVHAIQCPTFQGAGSAFSKSLGGTPSIGGTILSWRATEDGTLRDFNLTLRSYYEREAPRELQKMAEMAAEPALYEPQARRIP